MTDPEKEPEKQQGLSKEAWTAISAIAVALIGLFPVIWNTLQKISLGTLNTLSATGVEKFCG